jgi:putative transcriptional regulator
MIRHHPSDSSLIARAAGSLTPLHVHVLAVHLSACQRCRDQLRRMEEVGGALLTALPPQRLGPHAFTRIMARLDDDDARSYVDAPPASVTLEALAVGRWFWLGPGIRLMPLTRRDASGTRLDLIKVSPGVALPGHGHTGAETSCILQGGYRDETGVYEAFDIAEGDAALEHTPVASPGLDCVCLIATTGRLRAKTWLARMVQPLIGV